MAERPVECSHCKKPIKIIYKEILEHSPSCIEMCEECPIFHQKLSGAPISSTSEKLYRNESGLCCHKCRTTLESVTTGNPLGCSECYAVFADLLIAELKNHDKIPARIRKTSPLHIGKNPNESATLPSSSRLTALNEALNDALKKENYEQAAWIRDQIKTLKEKGGADG